MKYPTDLILLRNALCMLHNNKFYKHNNLYTSD